MESSPKSTCPIFKYWSWTSFSLASLNDALNTTPPRLNLTCTYELIFIQLSLDCRVFPENESEEVINGEGKDDRGRVWDALFFAGTAGGVNL